MHVCVYLYEPFRELLLQGEQEKPVSRDEAMNQDAEIDTPHTEARTAVKAATVSNKGQDGARLGERA